MIPSLNREVISNLLVNIKRGHTPLEKKKENNKKKNKELLEPKKGYHLLDKLETQSCHDSTNIVGLYIIFVKRLTT